MSNNEKAICELPLLGFNDLLSKEDQIKYGGQFVCQLSFKDRTIIASDVNPSEALTKAREKGCKYPVIFYMPKPGEKFVFETN